MQRRKFLVGMGSLAAGGAAAMGTGAFEVQARDRTAQGTTVRDDNAYLQLKPATRTVNGHQLSRIDSSDGELKITLQTLNGDAETKLEDVFYIQNEGTGPVKLRIININEPQNVDVVSVPVTSGSLPNGADLKNNFVGNLGVGAQAGIGVRVDVTDKGTGGPLEATFDVDADEP